MPKCRSNYVDITPQADAVVYAVELANTVMGRVSWEFFQFVPWIARVSESCVTRQTPVQLERVG